MKFQALFRGGPDLKTLTRDLRNYTLLEAKEIETTDGRRFRMPVGATSDGASIPQVAWSLGFTPFGVYGPAAFAHDCAFRDTLEIWNEGSQVWEKAHLSEEDSNDLINALMFALGTPESTRLVIYGALVAFGRPAFVADRAEAQKGAS